MIENTPSIRPVPASEFAVRSAEKADVRQIVAIHAAAFPEAFLTLMGSPFLARYYTTVLGSEGGILMVGLSQKRIAGFIAGVIDPTRFYRGMRSHALRYAGSIIEGLIRRPYLARKVYANLLRVSHEAEACEDITACELTSIAVAPEGQSRGLGRTLVYRFVTHAWKLGARYVYLTTDADDNDAANAFYEGLGFQRSRTFDRTNHRRMNEYRMQLPCPAAEQEEA